MNSLNVGTPSILQDSKISLGILDIPAVNKMTSYPIPAQTQNIQIIQEAVPLVKNRFAGLIPICLKNCPTGPLDPTDIANTVVKIINGMIDGKKNMTLKKPFAKIFLKMKYEKNKAIGKVTKQETMKNANEDSSIS